MRLTFRRVRYSVILSQPRGTRAGQPHGGVYGLRTDEIYLFNNGSRFGQRQGTCPIQTAARVTGLRHGLSVLPLSSTLRCRVNRHALLTLFPWGLVGHFRTGTRHRIVKVIGKTIFFLRTNFISRTASRSGVTYVSGTNRLVRGPALILSKLRRAFRNSLFFSSLRFIRASRIVPRIDRLRPLGYQSGHFTVVPLVRGAGHRRRGQVI